ncbi:MAG: fatty acid desaturase [Acidobacteria bacterium]|nr:fatty acid desaturase [Acidobacteriota bacterium]
MPETHRSDGAALHESRPRAEDVHLLNVFYFSLIHLLPLGAFFSCVTRASVAACLVLYLVRIFFITAGYHCYFSHRAFRAGRIVQLVLALGAQSSGQGSALKWAATHRHHHAHSDSPADLHSPEQRGFWYSHMGWLFNQHYERVISSRPKDLTKFPELRWLDRYYYLPLIVLAALTFALLGWPGLFLSFGLSTVLTFHATFCVNSLCHMFGTRRYDVPDDSRNNWFVAIIMLGGGWHNNHHRHPRSARQGIFWWEIDVTYYVLRALACFHVVRNICEPAARLRYTDGGSAVSLLNPKPGGSVTKIDVKAGRS